MRFCRTTDGCHNDSSSIVLGTKGQASITGRRIWGETNWRYTDHCNPYQVEHDVLFKAIRDGKPVNNGSYMIPSTQITVMGQLSCYTGKEVTWEQVSNSDYYHPPTPEACHDDMEPPVKLGPDGSYPVPKPGFTTMI